MRGSALNWFKDYMTTRTQKIKYDHKLSNCLDVKYGVAKASGPWLCFVFYVSGLPKCATNCSINVNPYDIVN